MKKILISVLFLFVTMVSYSQIKVLSIEPDEADLTARINPKQDRNGFNCALLKITTIGIDGEQRRKFFFTGDMATQIVDVSFPPGEIWVYLSPGRSQLVIRHDDYGKTIYDMPYVLKEKTCYAMVITADKKVNNVVRNYLIIKADQPNALIYVDDVFVGEKEVFLLYNAGETHKWKIECNMYHAESGEVKISYTEKTVIDKIMRPAFGCLNVTSMPESGATVYVDGIKMGETPYKADKIKSGEYKVRVVKEMYYPEERTYVVRDGETTEAKMEMRGNYANVTVETEAGAEIYVDNEYKGTGSWTGKLMGGEHLFEARKESHITATVNVKLTTGKEERVVIPNPEPVYGTLDVATTPMGADIYVDGKMLGTTPEYITDILVGTRELRLEKQGYETVSKKITIIEKEVLNVNEKLSFVKREISSEDEKTHVEKKEEYVQTENGSSRYDFEVTGNKINGHEYVDLGLPSGLKWATCNVGANSPSEYGDYYAWGETTTKTSYTYENSKTYNKKIGDIGGNASYDAARANWGGTWRMPTKEEFDELLNKCIWTWTTQGEEEGYEVTGPNGNSIFLPAAGFRGGTSLNFAGSYGNYWSSTPYESSTQGAYYLDFGSGYHDTNCCDRRVGLSVRPVSE